jgi:hypothetical protein
VQILSPRGSTLALHTCVDLTKKIATRRRYTLSFEATTLLLLGLHLNTAMMRIILRMKGLFLVACVTILLLSCWESNITYTNAFAPPSKRLLLSTSKSLSRGVPRRHVISSSRLYFFFGKKDEKDQSDEEEEKSGDEQPTKEQRSRFLGGLLGGRGVGGGEASKKSKEEGSSSEQDTRDSLNTATAVADRPTSTTTKKHEMMTPQEQAASLRAQAERARLEAERMDAELTLEKIGRLEKELAKARKKQEPVDDLLQEMEALQAKMRGEPPKPKVAKKPERDDESSSSSSTKSPPPSPMSISVDTLTPSRKPKSDQPIDQERFESYLQAFQEIPDFLKMILAKSLDMSPDDVNDINATEVALRLDQLDVSVMVNGTYPVSDEEVEAMKKNPLFPLSRAAMGDDAAELSDDEAARRILASNYYSNKISEALTKNYMDQLLVDDSGFMEGLQAVLNRTEVDALTESLFPQCTRKEDQCPSEADALALVTDVLPKASFMPSGKPEPVAGGFLVRGTSKLASNDATIEAIDAALEKSSLNDKLSVFLINDYTILTEENMESPGWALTGNEPILMVLGPDITRERRRLLFSVVTAAGIASSWYLSIYPFLLNADIMKRAEEQMSLADSGMTYDLSWLTDMSLPLFGTFIGIHLIHELGHRLAAAAYKMELTVPTFVPSLITGITSAVTTFKKPPKNKQAVFDFAIAGPLAGMAASLVALYFGCQFTAFTDPQSYAMFPAMPLEILRQSTLGGGVIEYVLGSGSLGVPDAALGSSAVASINIPLHPIAIAGYIGLIVNALALLPIGTTDGGRIALTLFSRGAKLVVGQIFMVAMLIAGILDQICFCFTFPFVSFFNKAMKFQHAMRPMNWTLGEFC